MMWNAIVYPEWHKLFQLAQSLLWGNGGLRVYLIDQPALACLGEIRALDDEFGSGGSAAQICST